MFLWLTLLPIWMKTKNLMMMKPLIMTKKTVNDEDIDTDSEEEEDRG